MDVIQAIKERLRLEEYMEESGIEFVKKGKESWTARCWRHQDKTPSLVVSVGKGLFYCHSSGCEIGGDVISFREHFGNSDRSDAIRELATHLGIKTSGSKPDPIRDIMQRATELCTIELFNSKLAMDYVKGRGVTEETICALQIGYCPNPNWLKSRLTGCSEEQLRSMELDSFKYKHSLTLPCVHPTQGTIAHYVRPFSNSSSKYMGPSSANPTRWKGMMFGLDVARRHARETGIILVEGQFDCLTLHSYGFNNCVCALGSHPTKDQFELLGELHIGKATVLFDGDSAGSNGANIAIGMGGAVRVSIAFLPEGDPDDFVIVNGREALEKVISSALMPVDYIINVWRGALNGNGSGIAEGLAGAIAELSKLPYVDYVGGLSALSRMSGVPVASLEDIQRECQPDNKLILESERQVLAMCVKHPEYATFLGAIDNAAWTLSKHKEIARRIQECTSRGASEITYSLLGLKENDWIFTTQPTNFEYHVGRIKDSHSRRQLTRAGKSLSHKASDEQRPVTDIVSEHLREVSASASPTDKVEFNAQEVVDDAMGYIHERMSSPEKLPGHDLGPSWKNVTKVTLGLQNNRLYLVGAGPKVGKTTLALNWALSLAVERKVPTLWVNLEMSERDLVMRLFSMSAGLSSLRLQSGILASKEKELLDSHAAGIYASPFRCVNAHGMSVEEVLSVVRKSIYTHGTQIAFIDYIQLLNVSRASRLDYWEKHAEISTALKAAINANLNIPVVALSQLGRPAASEGSASGSFIGGSYKYVQDCDVFMGLRVRSDKELEDGQGGNLILNVEYNRHGPQDVYTRIYFNRDNLRMQEVE